MPVIERNLCIIRLRKTCHIVLITLNKVWSPYYGRIMQHNHDYTSYSYRKTTVFRTSDSDFTIYEMQASWCLMTNKCFIMQLLQSLTSILLLCQLFPRDEILDHSTRFVTLPNKSKMSSSQTRQILLYTSNITGIFGGTFFVKFTNCHQS